MVRPPKPRLMACVLDAVTNLGNAKGSSAREVLDFIQRSNVSSRNLTLQVQGALKHAVNIGLLRHRSGRYKKMLATPNPVSIPAAIPAKESANDDENVEGKKIKSQVKEKRASIDSSKSSRREQECKKKATPRQNNRRRGSDIRKKSQHSSCAKRTNEILRNRQNHDRSQRRQRKRIYKDEEFEDQSPEQYVMYGRNESTMPFNCRAKSSRVAKREVESSEKSDRESHVNWKRVSQLSISLREPKRKEARAKSRDRSTSQARDSQRVQARQGIAYPIEEVQNRKRCAKDNISIEHSLACEKKHKTVKGARQAKGSDRSSTPENSHREILERSAEALAEMDTIGSIAFYENSLNAAERNLDGAAHFQRD